ncbi:hypothetical protein [Nonomuraea sp. NPDC049141]|uniref:hypothetical protein n=1 Tax=Nonomuraea sp. NPDC049141 TaxID=3155500 RepID=UPI0033F63C10
MAPSRLISWLPAVLAAGYVVAVLTFYGVSARDTAVFGAYLLLCVTLPGLLLIRALFGRRRTLAEEVALGTVLGYAVEVMTYIVGRALGVPLLVLAWPIATYLAFLAVPRLRWHWRGGARPHAPVWWSWALAAIFCYLVAWSAWSHFSIGPLTWPDLVGYPDDGPFHLALIAELKQHMPPTVPIVAGEPLFYHWFVYAHYAATSWITGIEPMVLLFRLSMLPMLAAFVVLVAMLGRKVTSSWKVAVIATAATVFIGAPRLFLGSVSAFTHGGVHDAAWGSPTFTFGALIFVAVVLVLIDLLKHRSLDAGAWLLFAVLLVAVMGGKATHLPMLAAGLLIVLVVSTLVERRPRWGALVALAMTAVCLIFAQFVLFGGQRQGTVVAPLAYMGDIWHDLTGMPVETAAPLLPLLAVTAIYLLAWGITCAPVFGLLSEPKLLLRPDVVLMLGLGAAGLGAALVLDQPGGSHLWFLWAAHPYLATLAVYGLVVALRRARVSRRAALCAAGAGTLCAYAVPILCGVRAPLSPGQPVSVLFLPYVVLADVLAVAVGGMLMLGRSRQVWALVLAGLAAIGLPAAHHVRALSRMDDGGDRTTAAEVQPAPAPGGVLSAARWLRAHAGEDDLIATNVHCRWGFENPCDTRQFWVSALTERRVLIEGWAFTPTNADRWQPGLLVMHLPFWDRVRYDTNEAAFRSPSTETISRLRDHYGVRWLIADESRGGVSPDLPVFAQPVFRSSDVAVYRTEAGAAD